jgi:hypothetical protein
MGGGGGGLGGPGEAKVQALPQWCACACGAGCVRVCVSRWWWHRGVPCAKGSVPAQLCCDTDRTYSPKLRFVRMTRDRSHPGNAG